MSQKATDSLVTHHLSLIHARAGTWMQTLPLHAHLKSRRVLIHAWSIKVAECQGPCEPSSGLNRLALKWEREWVCVCGGGKLCCKCCGVVIEAMRYPGIICQFAADLTEVRIDRIMSGEHPQCIWRSHWKVQRSDYTPIREQSRVKTCQFPGLSSKCEKLRDDCSHKALHLVARFEEKLQFVYQQAVNTELSSVWIFIKKIY